MPSSQLTTSRKDARTKIRDRISKGEAILLKGLDSATALRARRDEYYTWDEYNRQLLKSIFSSSDEAEAYSSWVAMGAPMSLQEQIDDLREDVTSKIRRLKSLDERLELFDEPAEDSTPAETQKEIAVAERWVRENIANRVDLRTTQIADLAFFEGTPAKV